MSLFLTRPHPWSAEPSLAGLIPPLISNPLSNFPATLTLPIGCASPAVFAVFGVELSSVLEPFSSTAVTQIKSVMLLLNKCQVQFLFNSFPKSKAHSFFLYSPLWLIMGTFYSFLKNKVLSLPTRCVCPPRAANLSMMVFGSAAAATLAPSQSLKEGPYDLPWYVLQSLAHTTFTHLLFFPHSAGPCSGLHQPLSVPLQWHPSWLPSNIPTTESSI